MGRFRGGAGLRCPFELTRTTPNAWPATPSSGRRSAEESARRASRGAKRRLRPGWGGIPVRSGRGRRRGGCRTMPRGRSNAFAPDLAREARRSSLCATIPEKDKRVERARRMFGLFPRSANPVGSVWLDRPGVWSLRPSSVWDAATSRPATGTLAGYGPYIVTPPQKRLHCSGSRAPNAPAVARSTSRAGAPPRKQPKPGTAPRRRGTVPWGRQGVKRPVTRAGPLARVGPRGDPARAPAVSAETTQTGDSAGPPPRPARGGEVASAAYSRSGASSPGHLPVRRAKPRRALWSVSPFTSRKIAPSISSAGISFT
jgi:hypothetical protein